MMLEKVNSTLDVDIAILNFTEKVSVAIEYMSNQVEEEMTVIEEQAMQDIVEQAQEEEFIEMVEDI
jgi:hypothetical protein